MKHLYAGILLTSLFLISAPAWAAGIQSHFEPFTALRVIQTEHFDIIFPPESESSARLLASYADRTYEQVSSLLGIEVPFRIPVTFTPHTDQFNGYYGWIPLPRIMLFDTPMDLEWTNFANNLEQLFLHELTHAVSLNTRSRSWRVFHRIFGNWVTPAWVTAPGFMVEGVAVSFESLSGTGRANDPLTKQKLRQALYEDKFLTPFQASGVYDIPGQASMYYEYGGPFSAWLQQTYGMEKYAKLWQVMGAEYPISFFVYRSDFYGIFRKVYAVNFLDAWNAFSATLTLDGLEENPGEILPQKYRFLSERERFINALVAKGNNLYFLDSSENKIHVHDINTEKTRIINADSSRYPYDIDVCADGTLLLVSGYRYVSGRAVATVTEHRVKSGLRTGRNIRGIGRARYFRDGVIGLCAELHNTCIAYEDFNGNREILFRGNDGLVFSGPQAVDNERIVFVAARNGVRELWLYNYVSRELFRVEDSDNEHWLYMRGLSVSEGKLFFSHNADDRMYKLASVDLETMQAVYSGRDFSGGVFNPVATNGAVYYTGSFFSRDGLLRFPEPAGSLSGTQSDLTLVELDNNTYEIIAAPDAGPDAAPDTEPVIELVAELDISADPLLPILPSKPYFGLRYMNPLQFWLPMVLPRIIYLDNDDFDIGLDGGFMTLMADPAERNMVMIYALTNIQRQMASIEQILWQNTFLGFPLQTGFSDTVIESEDFVYRSTNVSLSGSLVWTTGRWAHIFSPGGRYTRFADEGDEESAYYWKETGRYFSISTEYTLSNIRQQSNELFGTGMELYVGGVSITDVFKPRIAGRGRASVETRFPLKFTLFGIYDGMGMDLHGVSRLYGGGQMAADYTLMEYPHPKGLDLNWLAGGEAAMGLFSVEIQRNISHLYFNRFFGIMSVRNVLYDSKGHADADGIELNDDLRLIQSLRLKLAMKVSVLPFIKTPVSIEPYIWGAWKFSNTITGKEKPLSYSYGATDSFGFTDSLFFNAGFNISF
jgi:hypothetical protein